MNREDTRERALLFDLRPVWSVFLKLSRLALSPLAGSLTTDPDFRRILSLLLVVLAVPIFGLLSLIGALVLATEGFSRPIEPPMREILPELTRLPEFTPAGACTTAAGGFGSPIELPMEDVLSGLIRLLGLSAAGRLAV